MHNLIIASFTILAAGFLQSTTGFGLALVATPLLLFMFEAKWVIVINIILGTINSALILFRTRKHVDRRRVVFLALGCIFGIAPGAYLLSNLNPATIKLVIAALIIPSSILLLLGYSYQLKRYAPSHGVAGFISGILAVVTSIGGPPVILFLLSQEIYKERFIGTLNAYFLFLGLLTIGTYSYLGMVTVDLLRVVLVLLPALALGFYIGSIVTRRISSSVFKKIAISVILLSAVAIIVTTTVSS